jgi:hypothetical protein
MSRRLALPDVDPSIALTQAARQDFEHKFAHRPTVDQRSSEARTSALDTSRLSEGVSLPCSN